MNDSETLCCCEFIDNNNQINHILACCCNCVDLDEACDSLITRREINVQKRSRIMATLQDRLRIPWKGGARQISFDAILPLFILPVMFIVASLSLWWTIFSFTAVTVILLCVFSFFIKNLPTTKFFFVWTITSIVILYLIFELIVIPFLEILIEENIALTILIGAFLLNLHMTRLKANQWIKSTDSETESGILTYDRLYNCSICQITVPDKDHHCFWFDCCIGRHNQCFFILTLFFATATLVYSSNLTLTSVCHPFIFYKTILLPDDCSDVYEQFELGLSFVSALYSLGVAVILLLLLIQQIILVSLGMSLKDWKSLSFLSKCFLGICANRPHSRGFFKNWQRIICSNRSYF